MRKIIIACFIAALTLGSGCQTTSVEPVAAGPVRKIAPGARIYIVTPRDGRYGDQQYQGSGETVASAFDGAFSRYADSVIIGSSGDDTKDIFAAAKEKQCQYIVIPKIIHWEDRATEWSGIRDKMEIFVKVVSVETNIEVVSAYINGKSGWATFGGDHPEDLVKAPVAQFAASLFR